MAAEVAAETPVAAWRWPNGSGTRAAAWARLIHLWARLVAGHGLDVETLKRRPELDSSVIGVNFRVPR